MPFIAEGVIPATLVAFHQDFEIWTKNVVTKKCDK